jgi:hypothetical protein
LAPEFPPNLIVFNSRLDDDRLVGNVEYIEAIDKERLRVRWNSRICPEGYKPVGEGVAYYKEDDFVIKMPVNSHAEPDILGPPIRYRWTQGLRSELLFVMIILILPNGHTLLNPTPLPSNAKAFNDRLAVYWMLEGDHLGRTSAEWGLKHLSRPLSEEVANVNNLTKKPQNTQNDIIDFGQLARKREQSKKLREVITPILNFDTIRTICLDLAACRKSKLELFDNRHHHATNGKKSAKKGS